MFDGLPLLETLSVRCYSPIVLSNEMRPGVYIGIRSERLRKEHLLVCPK